MLLAKGGPWYRRMNELVGNVRENVCNVLFGTIVCKIPQGPFEISQKLVTVVIVNSLLPRKYNKSHNISQ